MGCSRGRNPSTCATEFSVFSRSRTFSQRSRRPFEITPRRTPMPATLTANWNYPTRVLVGPGRLAELGEACKSTGIAQPLIVTDKGLADGPVIEKARASLDEGRDGSRDLLRCSRQPDESQSRRRPRSLPQGVARRRRRDRRRLGARRRQDHRLHERADPPGLGLRGRRRLVDEGRDRRASPRSSPCRRRRAPARRSAAPRS